MKIIVFLIILLYNVRVNDRLIPEKNVFRDIPSFTLFIKLGKLNTIGGIMLDQSYKNLSLQNLPNEIWKDIPNYEGFYQVSDMGRVKSLKRKVRKWDGFRTISERILKPDENKNEYLCIVLYKKGKSKSYFIHQLVMFVFKGSCPEGYEVNHKKGIKHDNRARKLEYVTHSENQKHAYRIGLQKPSQNQKNAASNFCKTSKGMIQYWESRKRKVNQYDLQNNFIKTFNSIREATYENNTFSSSISACCGGKLKTSGGYIWKYVKE